MKRRLGVVAAVAGVLSLSGLIAGPASAQTHSTREGLAIELTAAQQSVRKVAPLDSSPTSGEALLSSNIHAGIAHIDGKKVRATVELGYQIGYPVQVAPDGVKVTAHTPELKLTGGVNAKVAPDVTVSDSGGGGSVGEIGGELGAEATVIPSADLEFTVGAGKITTVTLAEIALTKPVADIVLSGVDVNVTNAVGPISVRPFAKISVTSETGVYVYYAYGKTSRI
ncbi:MspA family porin [Gordonia sp. PP30]|uniref:MspA family porin n=1 Tax=Gordonia sp. PP30 TaxID=2935861 RepID=UPI001FFEAB75|nr:MspA family porin [Gordonia sp. PP30]UQE75528.1 MspA family porin [Gordonia sp. PP30]